MTFECTKKSTKIIKTLILARPFTKLICKGSHKFAPLKTIKIFEFLFATVRFYN